MLPALIVMRILKLALKGRISEKAITKIVVGLGDILVKSTKNDLDDKLWLKVKEVLTQKSE